MSRLIDADELLKKKRKVCGIEYVPAVDIIRAPTVGAERNERHGLWMLHYMGRDFVGYKCSICGQFVGLKTSNRCPRCDNPMDGGERR